MARRPTIIIYDDYIIMATRSQSNQSVYLLLIKQNVILNSLNLLLAFTHIFLSIAFQNVVLISLVSCMMAQVIIG